MAGVTAATLRLHERVKWFRCVVITVSFGYLVHAFILKNHFEGIRDYQVRMLAQEKYDEDDYGDSVLREMRIPSQILWLIFTFSLALEAT